MHLNETKKTTKEFEDLVKPIIKYLCENYNEDTSLIIMPSGAELVESKLSVEITEFIKD
jgi:UDP-N-acetylglucosamine pyrophosphorylase